MARWFILYFALLTNTLSCFSQLNYGPQIRDGSFEEPLNAGTSTSFSPEWWRCGNSSSNNSADRQPGNWGVTLPAYHGEFYAGIVTKPHFRIIDSTQREYFSQFLSFDPSQGDHYFFVMYLASSPSYRPNGSNPEGRLRILRSSDYSRCLNIEEDSLLWVSPTINENSWSLHIANVQQAPNGWIFFEAENTDSFDINCNVLIDSLAGPFKGNWTKPELREDQIICEGDSTEIHLQVPGTGQLPDSITYQWSDGFIGHSRTIHTAGEYAVCSIWKGLRQCDTFIVTEEIRPNIGLPKDSLACLGQPVVLSSKIQQADYEYFWSTGQTSSEIEIFSNETLIVQASNGICTVEDTVHVLFRNCEVLLEMPNVFSPNGDGINDIFRPMNTINIYSIQIDIYDRWGRKVAVLRSLDQGWDGSNPLGQTLPEGVYFWAARYQGVEDEEVAVVKGNVTLVR